MRLFSRWQEAAVNSFGTPALFSLGRHALAAWLVVAWLSPNASAEIIIDDFDDDLRIDLPEDDNKRFLVWDVSDVAISRTITAAGIETDPVGFLDINQSRPSTLTARIPNTVHPSYPGARPALWINLEYGLTTIVGDGVDLTESGKNDAIFLTFDRLTAATPLRGLQVSATYGPTSAYYISELLPMPQSSDPFTLVFPFDEFRLGRGSPADEFVFTNVRELSILISLSRFDPNLPEHLDFEMELAEFQIGRVVPEPTTIVSFTLMLSILGSFRLSRSSSRFATGKTCEFAGFLP